MEHLARPIYMSFQKFIKFPKQEKFYLLNYIKAISASGQDEKLSIKNKITEYRKRKKFFPLFMVEKVEKEIDQGKKFAVALKKAGILDEREYHILMTSKGGLAQGIEKILETSSRSNKSKAAFFLLILPPSAILIALLASHETVKQILINMLEPIRSAGGTPPPIKEYLMDPTAYIIANVAFFTVLSIVIAGYMYMKRFHPKKFLGLIPIVEQEYTLDILKSLKTVMAGGGINISNASKALATGEPDRIKRMIFETIVERTSKGKKELSVVLEEFNVNYNTISSLKIGEDSNNIDIGLKIALDELEERYAKDISRYLKIGMWGGQFGMIGIAMKPIVDIMLIMSIGQLNFQV